RAVNPVGGVPLASLAGVPRSVVYQVNLAEVGQSVEHELNGQRGEQEAEHLVSITSTRFSAHPSGPVEHRHVNGDHKRERPDDDGEYTERPGLRAGVCKTAGRAPPRVRLTGSAASSRAVPAALAVAPATAPVVAGL